MARWTAHVEAPLAYDYGRYTVCKTGPWGQGLVMLQQLALLKGFDLDRLDPASADFIHLQVECAKLAYADREEFYGDPDFVDVPMAQLLSDAYNAERRKLVSNSASPEMRPGSIPGYGAKVSAPPRQRRDFAAIAGAGEPTVGELAGAGDTVHFDIIDRRATWCRPRPPAAGCNLRRSSQSLVSRSAPVPRCSGWMNAIRLHWRRESGRARR